MPIAVAAMGPMAKTAYCPVFVKAVQRQPKFGGILAGETFDNPHDPDQVYRSDYQRTSYLGRHIEGIRGGLVVHLLDNPSTPPKIWCFGGSDGAEAYTIALDLIQTFGAHEAQRFFPIHSLELDTQLTQQNQAGVFKSQIEEKHDFATLFPKLRFEDYFDFEQDRVKPSLHGCVNFVAGDMLDTAQQAFSEPTVLFCRNAVYWLPPDKRVEFADHLSRSLPPGSRVVVGNKMKTDADLVQFLCVRGFYPKCVGGNGVIAVKPPQNWFSRAANAVADGFRRVADV